MDKRTGTGREAWNKHLHWFHGGGTKWVTDMVITKAEGKSTYGNLYDLLQMYIWKREEDLRQCIVKVILNVVFACGLEIPQSQKMKPSIYANHGFDKTKTQKPLPTSGKNNHFSHTELFV